MQSHFERIQSQLTPKKNQLTLSLSSIANCKASPRRQLNGQLLLQPEDPRQAQGALAKWWNLLYEPHTFEVQVQVTPYHIGQLNIYLRALALGQLSWVMELRYGMLPPPLLMD